MSFIKKATKTTFFMSLCLIGTQSAIGQGKSFPTHINLGRNINTPSDEQNLVLSPDGNILYFTINKHAENIGGKKDKGDIWYSEKDNEGNWKPSINLSTLNNKNKNAVLAVLDEGKTLLLQGHYEQDGSTPRTFGLSVSRKRNGEWSFPEKLSMEYFQVKSEDMGVTVSADQTVMILSMESYGSFGAEDLYVSFLRNGKWSDPQNLGMKINTKFQELSPYLSADNKTLYFSSNGRKGFGSKDVYMTVRQDDTWKNWSEPINLGNQVNTEGSETFFIQPFGSEEAFLISTQNSDGYGDINKVIIKKKDQFWHDPEYKPEVIEKQEVVVAIQKETPKVVETSAPILEKVEQKATAPEFSFGFKVVNDKTGEAIKASLQLTYQGNERKLETDEIGNGLTRFDRHTGEIVVKIMAPGFFEEHDKVAVTSESVDISREYSLKPLEVGTTIQLSNILFERGTSKLLDSSFDDLEKVVTMLKENQGMEIELSGHTDNTGSSKLNIQLSQERVETVKKILVERGVEERRIKGKGYGGTKPIASNKGETTRKLNRRVEFTILKMD
jgi:OmpA-OmpF porin, OOP family